LTFRDVFSKIIFGTFNSQVKASRGKHALVRKEKIMKNTYMQKAQTVERAWYLFDATDISLGRLAAKVAHILRGKNKTTFTPHVDCGDNVVIINASKVNLTGNKLEDKIYYDHSGYTGGLRERTAKVMKENYPVEMVERAIKGMLPKGRLGRAMYKKLFVYAGEEHPHMAQKPVKTEVK
jgi:large subunit ribosomal protein L13